ncbi:MAG: hypothetical protein GXP62_05460 [Oligoflexia bacterium]|nr:hypothetical protein [Oligoflexia bacterium]
MTWLIAMLGLVACGNNGTGDTGAAGLDVQPLGSYTTDTGGLTGNIPLEIPDGTSSVLVHCGDYGYDVLGTAWDIKDSSGAYYYTNQYHDAYAATQMRVGNLDDHLPVLFPVSPDHDISSGSWSINAWIASGGTPTTVDCEAIYRTDPVGSSGTIDLNVVLVGLDGLGLDASTAADDADLQAALSYAQDLWSDAGLVIGNVTYLDFKGNVDRYSVVDISDTDASEFGDLLKQDVGGTTRAMTVFFVQEIADASGATVLGLAAGPPGAATVTGTSKSGMVVTTADLRDAPNEIGLILAHEGAHFLGLFHTSEKTGDVQDPLSDTPECTEASNTDGNSYLDRDECAGKGADNVMFWAPAIDISSTMTADQGWVLRRNPAVH